MNKKISLVFIILILGLSVFLVVASVGNFKSDIKNYGQCVANATYQKNICNNENNLKYSQCIKETYNLNEKNRTLKKQEIKICKEKRKEISENCKNTFKKSKEDCLIFKCNYNQTDKKYLNIKPSQCKTTEIFCEGGFEPFKDSCGCGCKKSKPKICEDYRYSTCPEKCEKKCVPGACNGEMCTDDCEGAGSCFTPKEDCLINSDCKENEFCELKEGACLLKCNQESSKCISKGKCEKKPEICSTLYKPVCGCDDNTYANDCIRKFSGISKAKDGECNKKDCEKLFDEIKEEYEEIKKCSKDDDGIIANIDNLPCTLALCESVYNKNANLTKILDLSLLYKDNKCGEICPVAMCMDPSGEIAICENHECKIKTGEKNYCPEKSRNVGVCFDLYKPVCGWFDSSIECIKYPCAQTFSNSCEACLKTNVLFWTDGKCPK